MIFIRDENMIRETDKRSLDRFPNRIRLDQNLLTSHPTCGIIWRTVVAKLRPEVLDNRGPGTRVRTGNRSDRVLTTVVRRPHKGGTRNPGQQAETRPVGSVSRRSRAAEHSLDMPRIFSWDTGTWDKTETDLGQKNGQKRPKFDPVFHSGTDEGETKPTIFRT